MGLQRMLRIHLLQHWFNLADEAKEEALYDSAALRAFVGIDLGREPVPDATSLLRFRHLLERHRLGEAIFTEVGHLLEDKGLKLSGGTIVDATLIAAHSSTKNAEQARDPEMKRSRKGKQWYFGMKEHVGADAKAGVVHAAVVTAANVHDKHAVADLLHRDETRVYGDRGYQGCTDLITKNRTRARVEHVFHVLKRQFGFAKVRYRGLAKNANRVFTALALVNLVMAQRRMPGLVRP
jgi:IS5 family transposase